MKTFTGIFIFLIVSIIHVHADHGRIMGKITDKSKNTGIPGVNIYLEGTEHGNFSDGGGKFSIDNIQAGTYRLKISAIGYIPIEEEVVIQPYETEELYYEMAESIEVLEGVIVSRVSLIGGSSRIDKIPGSAHFISQKELSRFNNTDVNRILRNIPGIIIQEEDGFGLRPNIGMRGTGVERSSKITIMEDGILMAPAAYAAPAAYYFPSAGRMSGIEVRKGSSQIKYGPNTTGGAINFLSSFLPDDYMARVNIIGGSYGYRNIFAGAGKTFKNGGILVESFLLDSDGFKDLDNGGNTGFSKEDYIVKGRINTDPDARIYQALNFKIGRTRENSNETYLGLTGEDFEQTPFRRYAGSQVDNMDSRHTQWHFRHLIQPLKFLDITTTVYRNEFYRNWYKLDKVKGSADGSFTGIADILVEPEVYTEELSIIKGSSSDFAEALAVKANNRNYYAQGIESIVGLKFSTPLVAHEIEMGIRFHQDQMDRFQWVDLYRMNDGNMQMTEKGVPGTDSNKLLDADALSTFIQYELNFNKFLITAGLRYENISFIDKNYGKNDPERTGNDLTVSENRLDVFIPGIGVDYQFNSELSGFIGVHKGFSPPGAQKETYPETSNNFESGIRYGNSYWKVVTTAYLNDYDNLLGADLAATGGSGTVDQFNGGESLIYGLEHEMTYDLAGIFRSGFSLPLTFQYTYTHATFENDFESEYEPWGTVSKGDFLPYVPAHQFAVNMGYYYKRIMVDFSSKYVGDMRTVAGQDEIPPHEKINRYFICDVSANYRIAKFLEIYGGIFNLFDQVHEVSRRPAGLRPGMPQNFRFGIKAYIE
ncbi:MAG: TonB-dependent receptor [Cyclobacteriaceae bacterium]|nr:TonB-dependent receptor [Cyclobacteriaceae bacterium]